MIHQKCEREEEAFCQNKENKGVSAEIDSSTEILKPAPRLQRLSQEEERGLTRRRKKKTLCQDRRVSFTIGEPLLR